MSIKSIENAVMPVVIKKLIITKLSGLSFVVMIPQIIGKIISPTAAIAKRKLLFPPVILTYCSIRVKTVGKMDDIPNPYSTQPIHKLIVSLKNKIYRAATIDIRSEILSMVVGLMKVEIGIEISLPNATINLNTAIMY